MKKQLIGCGLAAALAFHGASICAQTALPPVKDVRATIGNSSRASGPFFFCTLPDAAPLASVPAVARKPAFLIGWTIEEAPATMARAVVITSLPKARLSAAGCLRVQRLPAGGVDKMRLHVPYAIVDQASDWSVGFTALVMALKNDDMPAGDYIPRLRRHVKLVTQLFASKGMDGYMVYAGDNFEWAYLHWKDEDTAKRAFATPHGATGPQDSRSIQRPLPRTQIFPAAK
jgi:hypothetical protein